MQSLSDVQVSCTRPFWADSAPYLTAFVASSCSTMQSEAQSSFLDTNLTDPGSVAAQLELLGQLSGDISDVLRSTSTEVGEASLINISCTKLIRLDFMAAGDLLNWVLQRRTENRMVVFNDAHRLVALFFGAMGINEHAKVKVRVN